MTVPNRYELLFVEEAEVPVAPVAVATQAKKEKKVDAEAKESHKETAPKEEAAAAAKPVVPTKTVKEYMEEKAAARLAAMAISRPEARRANDGARAEGEALPEKTCSLTSCDKEDTWIFGAKKESSSKKSESASGPSKQFVQASLLSFKSVSNIEEEHKKAAAFHGRRPENDNKRSGEKRQPRAPRRAEGEKAVAEGADEKRDSRPRRQPRRDENGNVVEKREYRSRAEGERRPPRGEGAAKHEYRPRNESGEQRRPYRPRHEEHRPSSQRREQDFPALSA